MRSRFLHILVLLFATLWLSVIAPGHTRGTIKIGGGSSCETSEQAEAKTPSCCPMPEKSSDGQEGSHDSPPSDPASCCAICYLNSVLDTPVPFEFITLCVGELQELEPLEPASLTSILTAIIASIRGPPLQLA